MKIRTVASDDGMAVVRIKPLGAGGGGGERSAAAGGAGASVLSTGDAVRVIGRVDKTYTYPSHVIAPEDDNQALYDMFMPQRVEAFLNGINANIMCYGQTGSICRTRARSFDS